VPRQPDADDGDSRTFTHGGSQHRERDRQAEFAVEHIVEVAVAGVVIVVGVPGEAFFLE